MTPIEAAQDAAWDHIEIDEVKAIVAAFLDAVLADPDARRRFSGFIFEARIKSDGALLDVVGEALKQEAAR